MDILRNLITLLAVAAGWLLSQLGTRFQERKDEKKKLNKLLFNLLEIRHLFKKEMDIDKDLEALFSLIKAKMPSVSDEDMALAGSIYKPLIKQAVRKNLVDDKTKEFLENNLDQIITDISELYPVLAYELTGRYRLREKFKKLDNYLDDFDEYTEQIPFDVGDLIKSNVNDSLINDLNETIREIAEMISKDTLEKINEILNRVDDIKSDQNVNTIMDEYINKLNDQQ